MQLMARFTVGVMIRRVSWDMGEGRSRFKQLHNVVGAMMIHDAFVSVGHPLL